MMAWMVLVVLGKAVGCLVVLLGLRWFCSEIWRMRP